MRWADSALLTGGPRLRLRAYGDDETTNAHSPELASRIARANCGLAYGAWNWDPASSDLNVIAGAGGTFKEGGGRIAFGVDVRFRYEEPGCACVARCVAAFKAGLETWYVGAHSDVRPTLMCTLGV